MVLEKTLESPMNCKEIKPVNPKGKESLVFIGMTDAKAETPRFLPPDGKKFQKGGNNICIPMTKVRLVKAMVFPVVMYECESWTIKKAEHRRIDVFELWCWRRLLRLQGDPISPF